MPSAITIPAKDAFLRFCVKPQYISCGSGCKVMNKKIQILKRKKQET